MDHQPIIRRFYNLGVTMATFEMESGWRNDAMYFPNRSEGNQKNLIRRWGGGNGVLSFMAVARTINSLDYAKAEATRLFGRIAVGFPHCRRPLEFRPLLRGLPRRQPKANHAAKDLGPFRYS
jgi:hypothetical protein